MLGIVVTSYQPHFFLYQDLLLSNLDRNKFKPIFLCSHENHDFVEMIGENINTELQYLDVNPGHHDGVYVMNSLVADLFDDCEHVLHYHADIWFGQNLIEDTYNKLKKGGYKIASMPRHWLFDDNGKYIDDKTVSFHYDFAILEKDLFKKCFDMNILDDLKMKSVENGHPSKQFEPCFYVALKQNGVDFDNDILYIDDVMKLKKKFGNNPAYYNFFNEDSGIFHFDAEAFNSGNLYNK